MIGIAHMWAKTTVGAVCVVVLEIEIAVSDQALGYDQLCGSSPEAENLPRVLIPHTQRKNTRGTHSAARGVLDMTAQYVW